MNKTPPIRHQLKCGNVVEITIFDSDPTHQTANILIKLLMNERKNQQSIYKLEPLDQTTLMLELRNVIFQKAPGKSRGKRSDPTTR